MLSLIRHRFFALLSHAALLLSMTLLTGLVQAEEEEEGPWSGSAELGYVSTSGNTETSSIKTRADAVWEVEKWRDTTHFESLNLEEDSERSAERYYITHKTDYKFTDISYAFAFQSFDKDRFSGYDWQATASFGYGRRVLKTDTMQLDLEAGPGYRVSRLEEEDEDGDIEENEAILRLYGKYSWKVSESAVFEEELSIETGSDKTITKSVTSLKTTIVGQLAMKLSYTIKYTSDVPVDTEEKDTETAVTILYEF